MPVGLRFAFVNACIRFLTAYRLSLYPIGSVLSNHHCTSISELRFLEFWARQLSNAIAMQRASVSHIDTLPTAIGSDIKSGTHQIFAGSGLRQIATLSGHKLHHGIVHVYGMLAQQSFQPQHADLTATFGETLLVQSLPKRVGCTLHCSQMQICTAINTTHEHWMRFYANSARNSQQLQRMQPKRRNPPNLDEKRHPARPTS